MDSVEQLTRESVVFEMMTILNSFSRRQDPRLKSIFEVLRDEVKREL